MLVGPAPHPVIENGTGRTWHQVKDILADLKLGIHRTQGGEVWQTSPLGTAQKELFAELKIAAPPRYLAVGVSTPASQ